ncbi:MHS family MFS transporter [Roseomonas sp. OT10]|uniref:MFS transporter n=1 Tax=Roseomonas cutis TaxID=2897332 RepID=UPI001E52BC2B|nr:MFS transporter [Roseomonas sp. OT10]UFN48880.1 MHS family MFS transporter [Roseomonas sp. OT10]
MDVAGTAPLGATEAHAGPSPRKAAIAAWIGSALEYYDFFIYGSAAALVFGKIFFPADNPALGTLLSFGTFGVAYVARPLGSFVMGHIGDKFGRKAVLMLTLFGMGACTFLIGLLPTYHQIGVWAPILLVLLRVCQGLAVSGEQSGATSMTVEHAPENRRAFFSSFTLAGTQGGLILATAVFLPISTLSDEALLSWGWRIPFLFSVAVMAVAWWIRRSLPETPAFEAEQEHHAVPVAPLKLLARHYVPDVMKVVFAALTSVISTLATVYALSYGVATVGLPRSAMLWMQILANVVALGAIPAWALLADRIGRKPVFVIGAAGSAILIWPFIWSITQANLPMVFLFGILMSGVIYSAYSGSAFAMFSEQFGTKVRLSGMAIGTQFGFALGGFAPTIAAALAGPNLGNWVPVAVFGSAAAGLAALSALSMRETYQVPLDRLGRPEAG